MSEIPPCPPRSTASIRAPVTFARRLVDRASEAHVPVRTLALRFGISAVRGRFPALRTTPVVVDDRGTRILADLSDPLGLSLYRYGLLAPEARLIQEVLRPGDVVIDGGAHVGVFTLVAAATVGPTGTVIACEPIPGTMERLRFNLGMNGFDWVETQAVALADQPGRREMFSFGSGSALSSFAPASSEGSEPLCVDVTCLDAIAGDRCQRVRLVKLDLEGSEVLALRGAAALLRQKPDFVIEVEPEHLERQGTTVTEMQAIFNSAGYSGYRIHGDRDEVVLRPVKDWQLGAANPNMFVSARSSAELPAVLRIADEDASLQPDGLKRLRLP